MAGTIISLKKMRFSQKPFDLSTTLTHENVSKIKCKIKNCNYTQDVPFEIIKLVCRKCLTRKYCYLIYNGL